ncbi:MAG: hypothetical protein ISS59_09230 [Desulfobacteraceae bacterium]|nr:hypothetical protein [Desulfobacteraceae bacterium]
MAEFSQNWLNMTNFMGNSMSGRQKHLTIPGGSHPEIPAWDLHAFM